MSDQSIENMKLLIRDLSHCQAAIQLSALDRAPEYNRTPRSIVSDIRDMAHRLRTDPDVSNGLCELLAEVLLALRLSGVSLVSAIPLAYAARLALDGRVDDLTPDEVIAALQRTE